MRVPQLVVFDLDACLWEPEMFELMSAPTIYDRAANGVRAGSDFVRLFPGALTVLSRCAAEQHTAFTNTRFAVASSTTEPRFAHTCVDQFLLRGDVAMSSVISYRQIYPGSKGRQHIPALRDMSGAPYNEMIFFDDCTYGDNCRDVASNCDGTLCVRTPNGLTEALFDAALRGFAQEQTGVL